MNRRTEAGSVTLLTKAKIVEVRHAVGFRPHADLTGSVKEPSSTSNNCCPLKKTVMRLPSNFHA